MEAKLDKKEDNNTHIHRESECLNRMLVRSIHSILRKYIVLNNKLKIIVCCPTKVSMMVK